MDVTAIFQCWAGSKWKACAMRPQPLPGSQWSHGAMECPQFLWKVWFSLDKTLGHSIQNNLFHGLLSFFSDLKYIPQPDINRLIFVWALFCFLFVSWSHDFYHSRFLISPLFLSRIFYEDAQLKKCDSFFLHSRLKMALFIGTWQTIW